MDKNTILIIVLALIIALLAVIFFTGCSWNILTQGEIIDDDTDTAQLEETPGDSLETLDFIEMEVGELECDTLPPDTTETP